MSYEKWVSIYWDYDTNHGEMRAHVRFTPEFMDLEAAGYSHGLSIGNTNFGTKEEAEVFANSVAVFMEKMLEEMENENVLLREAIQEAIESFSFDEKHPALRILQSIMG